MESGTRLFFEVAQEGEANRSETVPARHRGQREGIDTGSAPELRHDNRHGGEGIGFMVAGYGTRHHAAYSRRKQDGRQDGVIGTILLPLCLLRSTDR